MDLKTTGLGAENVYAPIWSVNGGKQQKQGKHKT